MPCKLDAISTNLASVQTRIAAAARNAGRDATGVQLLAVSKKQPPAAIEAAWRAGQRAFGENYLDEAQDKIKALAHLTPIDWHFIGRVQSNKTRAIAAQFTWVHTVDRLKIARRLAEQRPEHLPPLNICLQVNISHEASKSGVTPDALPDLAQQVAQLPRLRLRGLMALPALANDDAQQRQPLRRLHDCLRDLQRAGLALDTLSMGTSHDLEAAVTEGATIIRIGTAIFGSRES
ncbi:MAG TPA: YggS family pyridoxal phosphate-dependent enzyme, partial [Gammaproteobacteria bacterium]|nr:YggS family pyridoxal phosphate-dependent enzyme [Gammaproteobacteria bacterium]